MSTNSLRRYCICAITLLTVSLTSVAGHAASAEGVGVEPCVKVTDDYQEDPSSESLYFAWAEGFMSGANIARRDDDEKAFHSMSFDEQRAYLRAYCAQNPFEKYVAAVGHLYRDLHTNHDGK